MQIRLPPHLQYPITVTELLKQPGDEIARNEVIFRYTYKATITQDDYLGQPEKVEKIVPSRYESELEGKLEQWMIGKGDVLKGSLLVADIDEPCDHGIQYAGLCAQCGKDMTELNYNMQTQNTTRAGVNMIHDDVFLKISKDKATKAEEDAKRRLIQARKLSLVVDLDQTIIHATVDPTVGEWQRDPTNPNHEAVADVRSFQLSDDGPGARACWYYIKLRPGLQQFLETISKYFELHIYTMGTRAYAQQIAQIVDPDRKVFGDRILSRDESGSLTAKSLQRLFPFDTKMVVIIDDRGDVWKWNDNLVKVTPYDFFVGIGDINSSYLQQKQKIQATPTEEVAKAKVQNAAYGTAEADEAGDPSALDQLVSMGGGDDPSRFKEQNEKAAQAIDSQLEQRPLLQKQRALEQAEEKEASQTESPGQRSPTPEKPRHHILQDNDSELPYLQESLRQVHHEFYAIFDRQLADAQGGRLAELRSGQTAKTKPSPNTDLILLPDIAVVMPSIKKRVLEGVSIVFSGVIPLGIDIHTSDIAIWARSFGAKIRNDVSKSRTTHVIAARKGTAKVKQALRHGKGRIKVVSTQWLMDSIVRWSKQDEESYLLHSEEDNIGPVDARAGIEDDDINAHSDSEEPDDDDLTDGDTTDGEAERRSGIKLRLKISTTKDTNTASDRVIDTVSPELIPDSPLDENSPIGGNATDWAAMEDEMADFLGMDGESDNESVSSSHLSTRSGADSHAPRELKTNKRSFAEIGRDSDAETSSEGFHKRCKEEEEVEKEEEEDGDDWGDFEAAWDEADEEERARENESKSPKEQQATVNGEPTSVDAANESSTRAPLADLRKAALARQARYSLSD